MGRKNPFNPADARSKREGASDSPFAAPEPAPEPPNDAPLADASGRREIEAIPSSTWPVAGYLLLVLMLGLTGYSLFQQKRANDELREQVTKRAEAITAAEQHAFKIETALKMAQLKIDELKAEASELARAKEAATSAQRDLESEMRAALASKDVTISELQGKLTLSILDRILFDSGQAIIKPEGQEVLGKLAAVLDQFPNRQIHVTGHTDNVPIHTAQFPSNWELSAARALAAVRFLVEEAGVKPERLAAVANGEFQPVADNASPDGRAKNRRIAIVVLPEVFKSPETVPAPLPESLPPTAAPAAGNP